MIPVCEPMLDGNEREYVLACLETNWISSAGKFILDFEERFSAYCHARHGVACSNGTTAIHLALEALGIGPGDEVIIPCFTLIVSANMVILAGAKPVLVDVDPRTWCMDPDRLEEKISPRTRAIMAVHMYGHPCDMGRIMAIAERHGLMVIEDAAQAHGAEAHGRRVGGIGDVACFSFYANKNITTGEGGMVVTSRPEIAARARLLRNQAFEEPRFVHRHIGFNYRLTNIQAAIGLAQCERLDEKVARKREIARIYDELLKDQPGIQGPVEEQWAKNVYWMYGVVLGDEFGGAKEPVMARLRELGVETRAFFCPMHRQPVFREGTDSRFPDIRGRYPVSDRLWERGLYLPSGIGLQTCEIEEVAEKLLKCRR
jgi:perosamine synthetase